MRAAVAAARSFFDAYVVPPAASHVIVLDIDETALSNQRPRMGQAWGDWDWGLRPGQQAGTPLPRRGHTPALGSALRTQWVARWTRCQGHPLTWPLLLITCGACPGLQVTGVDITSMAPALEPVLALYKDLYRKGFSVTFITGR